MEKLFSAKCCLLGFESYKPIGELYCDFNIDEQKVLKYFIREYTFDGTKMYYNDIPIDYNTIEEIPEYELAGIDLSESCDLTYCDGSYIVNE